MPQAPSRTLWIDYLRSFLTILVVAHHSSLAYTTFASFDQSAYIRSTHPIVDHQRWVGLDIFENFNDVFFMSLMFLIAGLFVVKSIERKGVAAFIRDRFYRLFLPFLLLGTATNLIAHYPAYLVAHGNGDIYAYIADFFTTEQWPVGPPWFIWVLFVFNLAFAFIYSLRKPLLGKLFPGSPFPGKPLIPAQPNFAAHAEQPGKPVRAATNLFLFTFILYVPFAFWLGPGTWTGFGPFDFQISRAAWYFGYFLLGAWLGTVHFNEGIFGITSPLVNCWRLWLALCAGAYTLLTLLPPYLTELVKNGTLPEIIGYLIYFSIYVLSCTFSCLAFLTTFRVLVRQPNAFQDSLSENAYLIYLLHYPFVIWTQYTLLDLPLPAFFKFLITCLISIAGSWLLAALLRKSAFVKRYL
ncbi:acyltransferase [Dyadobacter beijingensis]|uniref:Acyltransferase n=1 Tax=Dyadobacter beijingensis TaxID=365489 RepID=A0ABQ2I7Q7_9BACT|nr:acyltransferase [Dyadobacter beijingensis]GGN03044.1 acyltransferase [Dyadobacter beijingensis]